MCILVLMANLVCCFSVFHRLLMWVFGFDLLFSAVPTQISIIVCNTIAGVGRNLPLTS